MVGRFKQENGELWLSKVATREPVNDNKDGRVR